MERMTIPDVIVDEKTTRRTIIDASKVKEHAMKFYWRLKSVEDILGEDYDLTHLRELVEADRDGRCKIIPVCKGKNCGTCEHFRRIPETRRGTCAVRPFSTDRWGGKKRTGFEPVQSHVACSQYKPALKGDQHGEQ